MNDINDRHDALDRDHLDDAVPEADLLEQERTDLDEGADPDAPSHGSAHIPDTDEANEADVLEQSLDVLDTDDDRGAPE